MDIKEKIKGLPDSPGVYMFKDADGEVIYVGKASSLKRRVSSYFQKAKVFSPRTGALVKRAADLNCISTATEAEALLLEANLIKEYKPRYNVEFKDDKSYPFLKLSTNEKFPALYITRERKNDGAVYYGPYTNVKLLKQALTLIRRIFPIRTCRRMPKSACLYLHLGQCPGPCVEKLDEQKYKEGIAEVRLFLEGRKKELIGELFKKMRACADEKNFEAAAEARRRIEALSGAVAPSVKLQKAQGLLELAGLLGLANIPKRIEAFDVSNISGKEATGSVISFLAGRPDKNNYRMFKIKNAKGINDYRMIREIVERRYLRLREEKRELPDLILIDGGKGHLNVALNALKRLGLRIPVMAVAKRFEHIFVPGKSGPIILARHSKTLHLLMRMRDEAHRFAHKYHGKLRKRQGLYSELDEIRGIGERRRKALINYFGSLEGVRRATAERLMKVSGIDERTAKEIIRHFKK